MGICVVLVMFCFFNQKLSRDAARQQGGNKAYVSMREFTSAYVSIRQHTSAYVSILGTAARGEQSPSKYICVLKKPRLKKPRCGTAARGEQSIRQHASDTSAYVRCGTAARGEQSTASHPFLAAARGQCGTAARGKKAYVSMRQFTSAYVSIR
jgi:hypothetical protein